MRNNNQIDMRKLDESYAEILFVARDTGIFSHNDLMSDPGGLMADRLTECGFMINVSKGDTVISSYHLTFKGHWLAYNFKRMVENEED